MYTRQAQYHETDQMGLVHHSNYTKWFEEARTHWLTKHGIDYARMEQDNILSPVTEMHVYYKRPTRYTDNVNIYVYITEYTGVKFCVHYEVRDSVSNELRATGHSKHCFINRDGKILSLKKLAHFSDKIMQDNLTADYTVPN